MKELKLDESVNIGGHRYSVNDFKHLSAGLQQLVQAYGSSFGAEGPGGNILVGVELLSTATQISYTGGWMYKDGKLWKVNPLPAQNIVQGHLIAFVFKTVSTYPALTYQSGGQHQVHIERQVDIVQVSSLGTLGQLNVDFTIPFYVSNKRLTDIIAEVEANKAHRLQAEAAWTVVTPPALNFLVQGTTVINQASYIRYKVIGKQLYLQVSIQLEAPSPRTFAIKFPTGIYIANAPQASIVALDTKDSTETCAVSFTAATNNNPALMNFSRGHNNTNQHVVSFTTILELA